MTIPSHSHSTASQPACMHDHPNWFWWTYLGGGGSGSWNDCDWSLSGRRSNRWKRGDDGRGDLNFDHLLSNSKEVILLWFLCCQRIDTGTGGCRGRRFGDKRTCNTNFTTNSTVTPGGCDRAMRQANLPMPDWPFCAICWDCCWAIWLAKSCCWEATSSAKMLLRWAAATLGSWTQNSATLGNAFLVSLPPIALTSCNIACTSEKGKCTQFFYRSGQQSQARKDRFYCVGSICSLVEWLYISFVFTFRWREILIDGTCPTCSRLVMNGQWTLGLFFVCLIFIESASELEDSNLLLFLPNNG